MTFHHSPIFLALGCLSALSLLSGCTSWQPLASLKAQVAPPVQEAKAPARKRAETLLVLTQDHTLVSFDAATPGQIVSHVPLKGLITDEQVLGMDFRVARGQLFAVTSRNRLLRVDHLTGEVTPIIAGITLPMGQAWGVDFNPTVDRIRVTNDQGHNLRLHPDTGAQVDGNPKEDGVQGDGTLRYTAQDPQGAVVPRIVAVGYTYNKENEKITTNYAIDAATAQLVLQGSLEGASPAVSPNTGQLSSVGPLKIEPFDDASFDINDINNTAYLVTNRAGRDPARLYDVDLSTGQGRLIAPLGVAGKIRGLAIVP